ncbi:MAG: hypothetical protein ABEH78_01285 [Haloferacaceae archaeon]
MHPNDAVLGPCPLCGEAVSERDVVIEYETSAGEPGIWAECPGCLEIVDPRRSP